MCTRENHIDITGDFKEKLCCSFIFFVLLATFQMIKFKFSQKIAMIFAELSVWNFVHSFVSAMFFQVGHLMSDFVHNLFCIS